MAPKRRKRPELVCEECPGIEASRDQPAITRPPQTEEVVILEYDSRAGPGKVEAEIPALAAQVIDIDDELFGDDGPVAKNEGSEAGINKPVLMI